MNNMAKPQVKVEENESLIKKVDQIDRKFEKLNRENKELKKMIQNKDSQFTKMNLVMDNFKKELISLKQNKVNSNMPCYPNINIKSLTKNKNLFNKNNKLSKDYDVQKLGNSFDKDLDTVDLITRLSGEDSKIILHMPKKVIGKSQADHAPINVPRLDMNVRI